MPHSCRAPASAALPPEALDTLEALYEAHHRQALRLAYRELGDVNAAEAMVLDALLTVWREDPEAVPTTGTGTDSSPWCTGGAACGARTVAVVSKSGPGRSHAAHPHSPG